MQKENGTKLSLKFFLNGVDKNMLTKGIEVELNANMDPNQCREHLIEILREKIDLSGKQLIVYLAGGIPFIGGTLTDFYNNKDIKSKNIYGVLTRPVSDTILNELYPEICNASDSYHKLLISPLCDSSSRGLSDMACLLGYFNHDGYYSNLFLCASAVITHFSPFITSLKRIIENNKVNGRDVITVCSTLFTLFKIHLPSSCSDDHVYEYSLPLCNLIANIKNPPEKLPIMNFDVNPNDSKTEFLEKLKVGPNVYFWKGDFDGEDFQFIDFQVTSDDIENSFEKYETFTPKSPLSLYNKVVCEIVKGKDHEYLYLMQSALKVPDKQDYADILDPLKGKTDSINIELFAQNEFGNDDAIDSIDHDKVKQIIMFDLDESESMSFDLKGKNINLNNNETNRIIYAFQCICSLSNYLHIHRIPSIKGLLSFSDECIIRCPLTPINNEFEESCFKFISPKNKNKKLLDSLSLCCEELVRYRTDIEGNELFENAVSRIIVFSDGNDISSEKNVENVIKELIINKIVVDCIIFNDDTNDELLSSICHITGGTVIQFKDFNETISRLEKKMFMNYEKREKPIEPLIPGDRSTIPFHIKPERINGDFLNKLFEIEKNRTDESSKESIHEKKDIQLCTPRNDASKFRDKVIESSRIRRLLREIHNAAECDDPNSPNFDPDMKIFTYKSRIDLWEVFIKGPEGTPYESRWWQLRVSFSELYPLEPPNIRFVTVPYHMNIASDGTICMDIINERYMISKHVVEILQEIKEVFLFVDLSKSIKMEAYFVYISDEELYYKLAKESATNNAKENYEDYLQNIKVIDEVPEGYTIEFNDSVPFYMISQITGRPLRKENTIISSTGFLYDKDELLQYISSRSESKCIFSGKYLDEKVESFDKNLNYFW